MFMRRNTYRILMIFVLIFFPSSNVAPNHQKGNFMQQYLGLGEFFRYQCVSLFWAINIGAYAFRPINVRHLRQNTYLYTFLWLRFVMQINILCGFFWY